MTRQRNPRGVSLLETVVAFSLISVLLLISAGWIHQTMRFASIKGCCDCHDSCAMMCTMVKPYKSIPIRSW